MVGGGRRTGSLPPKRRSAAGRGGGRLYRFSLAEGSSSKPSRRRIVVAERVELLKQLDAIASTIAESEDPVTWPCWMSYILEAMEDRGDGGRYSAFLRRLRFAIAARLDTGEW